MIKSHNFRETAKGDRSDLRDKLQQVSEQLEDRKRANVLLNTENLRLKRASRELEARLYELEAGRPGMSGETTALKALRAAAVDANDRAAVSAAEVEHAYSKISALNQQLYQHETQASSLQATIAAATADMEQVRNLLAAERQQHAELQREQRALQEQLHAERQVVEAQQQRLADFERSLRDAERAYQQLAHDAAAEAQQLAAVVEAEKQRVAAGVAADLDRLRQQQEEALGAERLQVASRAAERELRGQQELQALQAKAAEDAARLDAARSDLESRLAALRSVVEQGDWNVHEGQLLPTQNNDLPPSGCNVLEVMLHDISGVADLAAVVAMPLLRLDLPHLEPLHLALPAGLAAPVALQQVVRLHFPVAAESLGLLSSGTMRASIVEAAPALIGCFQGPAGTACLAAVMAPHPSGAQGVLLFEMTATGQLSKCLGHLSVDPASALHPSTAPTEVPRPPQQGCFLVELSAGRPAELLAAARSSGLFQCNQGGVSRAGNGNKWETWKVVESSEARQALTVNALKEVPMQVAASPWKGPGVVAAADIALEQALQSTASAALMRQLQDSVMAGLPPPPSLYEPSITHGTREATLYTPDRVAAASLQHTLRLHQSLELVLPMWRQLEAEQEKQQQHSGQLGTVAAALLLPGLAHLETLERAAQGCIVQAIGADGSLEAPAGELALAVDGLEACWGALSRLCSGCKQAEQHSGSPDRAQQEQLQLVHIMLEGSRQRGIRAVGLALERAAAALQLLPPSLHLLRATASTMEGPSAVAAHQAPDETANPLFSPGACTNPRILVKRLSAIRSRLLSTTHPAPTSTLPSAEGRADDSARLPAAAPAAHGCSADPGERAAADANGADGVLATAAEAEALAARPLASRAPATGSQAALDKFTAAGALYGNTVAASWAAAAASSVVIIDAAARASSAAGGQQPTGQQAAEGGIERLCTEPMRQLKALCLRAALDTLLGASDVVARLQEVVGKEGRAQQLWPSRQPLEAAAAGPGAEQKQQGAAEQASTPSPEQAPPRNNSLRPDFAQGAANAVESYRAAGREVLGLLQGLKGHRPTTPSGAISAAMLMADEHGYSDCRAGCRSGGQPALLDSGTHGSQDATGGDKGQLMQQGVTLVLNSCLDAVAQLLHPLRLTGGGGKGSVDDHLAARSVACSLRCSVAGWGAEACHIVTALLAQQLLLGGQLDAALKLVEHACSRVAAFVAELADEALKLRQDGDQTRSPGSLAVTSRLTQAIEHLPGTCLLPLYSLAINLARQPIFITATSHLTSSTCLPASMTTLLEACKTATLPLDPSALTIGPLAPPPSPETTHHLHNHNPPSKDTLSTPPASSLPLATTPHHPATTSLSSLVDQLSALQAWRPKGALMLLNLHLITAAPSLPAHSHPESEASLGMPTPAPALEAGTLSTLQLPPAPAAGQPGPAAPSEPAGATGTEAAAPQQPPGVTAAAASSSTAASAGAAAAPLGCASSSDQAAGGADGHQDSLAAAAEQHSAPGGAGAQHSAPGGAGAQHSAPEAAEAPTVSAAADGPEAPCQTSATASDNVHDASCRTATEICTAAAEQLGWRTLTFEHYADRDFESEAQLCGCIAAEVDACVVVGNDTAAVEATLQLLQQKGVVLLRAGDLLWQAMERDVGPSSSPLGETPLAPFLRRLRAALVALRKVAAAAAELPLSRTTAELRECLQGQHTQLSTACDLEWMRGAAEEAAIASQASMTQAVAMLLVAHSLLHQTTSCRGGQSDGAPVIWGGQASGGRSQAGEGAAAASSGGVLSLGARNVERADTSLALGSMTQHCGQVQGGRCYVRWLLGDSTLPAAAAADLHAMHTAVLDTLGVAGVRSGSQQQQRLRGDDGQPAAAQLDGACGKLHGAALVLGGVLAAGNLEVLVENARAMRQDLRDLASAAQRLQQAGTAAQDAVTDVVVGGASVMMASGLAGGATDAVAGGGQSGLWGQRAEDGGMSTESEDGEEGVAELPDNLLQLSSSFSVDA